MESSTPQEQPSSSAPVKVTTVMLDSTPNVEHKLPIMLLLAFIVSAMIGIICGFVVSSTSYQDGAGLKLGALVWLVSWIILSAIITAVLYLGNKDKTD